jgi:hypothetical protein
MYILFIIMILLFTNIFELLFIGRGWRRERSEGPANFGWPQEGTPWREGKGREVGLGDHCGGERRTLKGRRRDQRRR